MLPTLLAANKQILDKFDGVRFLFIVQVIEKIQKKAQFSFCGQREAFHSEIVLRGIQPYFLHGGALGLFCNATKVATFWRILRYIFTLWSRKRRF